MSLWLAIRFPGLGLALRWRAGVDALPAQALFDATTPKRLLTTVNAAAADAGVAPGMSMVQAQALCAELQLHARDEAAESSALAQLATWVYGYSAEVRLEPPDRIALEIGASLRLFGGRAGLCRQLLEDLRQLGFRGVGGLGRSLAAARLRCDLAVLERIKDPLIEPDARLAALERTPVRLLPLEPRALSVLEGSGIATLGALLKIAPAALRRRFGRSVEDYLQRLRNEIPEPGERFTPPDHYATSLELPSPTAIGDRLWFPLRRLINDLCLTLQSRDLAADRILLEFELEHADDGLDERAQSRHPRSRRQQPRAERPRHQRIECELIEASRDPAHLFELCRQRLDRTELVGRALSIRIEVPRLPPPSVIQGDLYDHTAKARADWPKLLERLRARLGASKLLRPQAHADHRPERAYLPSVWADGRQRLSNDKRTDDPETKARIADLATRPVWLLDQPQPIDPQQLQLLSDAERLEGGWWDGDDVRRDYYRALHVDGGQCWVFRELRKPYGWFLHGWFG